MTICFKCGEEKDEVSCEYGKNICKGCAPSFRKESKKEISKKVEEIF